MTGALDTRARSLALSAISRFGRAATWTVVTNSFDPSTRRSSPTETSHAVTISPPSPFAIELVDGVTIQASDVAVMIAASGLAFTPAIGDRVTTGSVSYRVVAVSPVASGELIAAYEVQCRK